MMPDCPSLQQADQPPPRARRASGRVVGTLARPGPLEPEGRGRGRGGRRRFKRRRWRARRPSWPGTRAMEAARDCAGALLRNVKDVLLLCSVSRPLTFMGSQTKKVLLAPLKHPARPFRVSSHDRSSRRGLMAGSLGELLSKTLDALMITSRLVTLVLEEDGTVVDTEEFFQTLGDNTHFMALEKGQKWTPTESGSHKCPQEVGVPPGQVPHWPSLPPRGLTRPPAESLCRGTALTTGLQADSVTAAGQSTSARWPWVTLGGNCVPARQPPRRSGIARVTLDLYKLNPRDVVGCLNVKATMYEMYSVSYDIRCMGLKALLRSLLRVLSHAAQVTGQFLVYAGTYMLQVLADTEEQVVAGSCCRQGVTSG
nr:cell death activator CIDE-A isoform X1 [Camelus dromedarius]